MIFDFLRKKKAKEENIAVTVKLGDLDNWVKENYKGKKERIDSITGEIYLEIKESVAKTRLDLKGLKEYEIRKADERVLKIIKDHREIYVKFVEEFLDDILKKHGEDADKYLAYYAARSVSFSKQSFKSFHITSEMIGKPLEKLINDFKGIDKCFRRIDELIKSDISKFHDLNRLIREITETARLKKENEESLEKTALNLDKMHQQINLLKSKDENLRKSGEYSEKEKLKKEIIVLSNQIKLKKEEIVLAFSRIKKGLKRLEWTEQNKHNKELLDKLVEDTWDALKTTDNNQISFLLEQLAEKTKTKQITEVESADIEDAKDSLGKMAEIKELESKLDSLIKKEEGIKITWSDEGIKAIEEDIRKNARFRENCETVAKDLAISVDALKNEIKTKIAEYLGKQVEII